MKLSTVLEYVGFGTFVSFLLVSVYVYSIVQLLPPGDAWLAPLIPFRGAYGDAQPLPGVSYTEALEASGLASFLGLFLYSYARNADRQTERRALLSLATPLKFFGVLVAIIVYTETHLLWGELWYGVKLVAVNPQGFPWGSERVAANTCFLPSVGDNCWFLNYDQLLFISLAAAVIGWVISSRRTGHESHTIRTKQVTERSLTKRLCGRRLNKNPDVVSQGGKMKNRVLLKNRQGDGLLTA